MDDVNAAKDLNAIRGLIERREIYRAVAARAAAVGGALSILTACVIFLNDDVTRFLDRPVRPREFALAWLGVFVVTVLAAAFFLKRSARDRDDVFVSARKKLAVRTIAPCLLIPAAFTAWFFTTGYLGAAELDLVVVWIVFYGLMLLATAFFAPRAMAGLGWAFLLTGLSVPVLQDMIDNLIGDVPVVLMGVAFGLYHLIFAAIGALGRGAIARQIDMP